MMTNVEMDLIEYGDMKNWVPKIGDMIFKDGVLFRWCALVDGIKGESVNVRKAGNPQLLFTGQYKSTVINSRQIKSARFGAFYIVSNGAYFV